MTDITLDDEFFWQKLTSACVNRKVGHFNLKLPNNSMVHLVSMSDSIKMFPFVRSKEELFETTTINTSKTESLSVVINGPTYGLTNSGIVDATLGSDPVPANETIQQGQIVRDMKVIGGKSSNMYYIANQPSSRPRYIFGRGSAPIAKAAVGNMGPLIINGLPFGPVNKYSPVQPQARRTGEPSAQYKKYLVQRSNKRFADNMDLSDTTGKVVVAHSITKNLLLIFLQPHGSLGISITGLRNMLDGLNLNSAVYLDGSDSVMLMINNHFLIRAASNKNETNTTGIGFKY